MGKEKNATLTRDYFLRLAKDLKPPMEFKGRTKADWQKWRRQWVRQLKRLMGPTPKHVRLEIRKLSTTSLSDHTRYKIVYRTEKNCWVPAWLLMPKGLKRGEKRPGLLCAHGHGQFGKDNVVAIKSTSERLKEIKKFNYGFGRKLAALGYVVIAPDWRSFGERVAYSRSSQGRDFCESFGNCASLFGYNSLTLNVWDAGVAVDVLAGLEEVDNKRIGCIGLSYGGRMTSFVSALDTRIKAAVVSGAMNTFADRIQTKLGSCGSQIIHGLLNYGDMPEVAGLIAPRALFFEKGIDDPEPSYKEYYRRVARVYEAAGAIEKLGLTVFKGGHVFKGVESLDWLKKHL